jgi:hypothetical protein
MAGRACSAIANLLDRELAHAQGEVPNDAEVQKFWQLCKEIQRRRALSCDRLVV